MTRAPGNASAFDGSGQVWFKVHQISAVTDGGSSITWPDNGAGLTQVASTFGGAQFYISCGQINVTGGGGGTPGPLVSIPGVYTGYEPSILINIYSPIPANYTQPGPAVWTG
ncbi:hypothetical protein EW026_g3321 [Hermanssonia centrifuga]|uniref:lytic cellulose monooxygenase (C4-dehydrogenating) n=1 Tax=Hermanssonia centrifuga TaxID=98765 RepID=A0A4S4KLL8_9APHY|nr:hypothetical protein EW026_g3321 [Hermanssonia centrifuga]